MITLVTFGLMLCKVFPETNRLRKFEGLKAESAVLTEDNRYYFPVPTNLGAAGFNGSGRD